MKKTRKQIELERIFKKMENLSQLQYARLLKDLGFTDNEIIVETGYYLK